MKNNKLFTIIASSILFLSGCGAGFDSGEGKKIGRIVKIGKHGMFCPTYEAEIIRGGFSDGSGVNGTSLHFTIKSEKLYDRLTAAMENQEEIELKYSKRAFTGPCFSDTDTIAVGFTVLKHKQDESKKEEVVEESKQEVVKELIQFEDDKL